MVAVDSTISPYVSITHAFASLFELGFSWAGASLTPKHPLYFLSADPNAAAQLHIYASICAWIASVGGISAPAPSEFDDPSAVTSLILDWARELGLTSLPTPRDIRAAHGAVPCALLAAFAAAVAAGRPPAASPSWPREAAPVDEIGADAPEPVPATATVNDHSIEHMDMSMSDGSVIDDADAEAGVFDEPLLIEDERAQPWRDAAEWSDEVARAAEALGGKSVTTWRNRAKQLRTSITQLFKLLGDAPGTVTATRRSGRASGAAPAPGALRPLLGACVEEVSTARTRAAQRVSFMGEQLAPQLAALDTALARLRAATGECEELRAATAAASAELAAATDSHAELRAAAAAALAGSQDAPHVRMAEAAAALEKDVRALDLRLAVALARLDGDTWE